MNARAGQIVLEILVNIVAPYLVFTHFDKSLGDVRALLASSVPPIAWSLFEFARSRRIDAVSLLVLAGIALSLIAFVGGGSVRLLQLRENLVTALVGLIFLGSVLVKKPLVYELARAGIARQSPVKVESFERLRDNPHFRRSMSIMTLVWGIGLLLQTAIACVLVYSIPISEYLIVGPVVGYAGLGALALWTLWFGKRRRRLRQSAESTPAP